MKNNEKERCRYCRFWDGPGREVDHGYCRIIHSSHQITSKQGDKEDDTCSYFSVVPNNNDYHRSLTSFPGNFYKGGAGYPIGR